MGGSESDPSFPQLMSKSTRVRVSRTKGLPPPPTTKVAVFYRAGYQCEYVISFIRDPGHMELINRQGTR